MMNPPDKRSEQMKQFDYIRSYSLKTAEEILGRYGGKARPVAGGTDLLGGIKNAIHPVYPEALVDIKAIKGLASFEKRGDELAVGAMTRLRDLGENPMIRKQYHLLADAALAVASPQIRNMGTLAGNICQEPRCWYYRNPDNTFACARKGGDLCNALTGDNRYHSIFGSMKVDQTPCTSTCPVNTDIPVCLEKIREGNLDGAAEKLLEVNPMPWITGRVCPHFCEQNCNRVHYDEAVSVRGIERFLGDYILNHHERFIPSPSRESGKSVAIIGAGPSGLAAACFLRRSGHRIVVFDRMDQTGGMLRYAIPAFRLPKDILDRFQTMMEGIGIEFVLGVEIQKTPAVSDILKNYHAVYMAGGAWSSTSINLEGEEHMISGLDFLTAVNKGSRTVPGKKVLVIGGGNVAVDVAVTAKRLGADEVIMACLEKREEMPALTWEVEQAMEENIRLMTSWGPSRVLIEDSKVTGMEMIACISAFDEEGCFSPSFDQTRVEIVNADAVILAVGQRPDQTLSVPWVEMKGNLVDVHQKTQATAIEGLYAGGDMVSSPATVIEAIASGLRAARAINQTLGVESETKGKEDKILNRFHQSCLDHSARQKAEHRPVYRRNLESEDRPGLTSEQILTETERCFNCGCVAVNASDIAPALLALDAKIKTTKRLIDAASFFSVKPERSTVLDDDELVTEVLLPAQKPESLQAFLKFRIRKAIDFPIVGVAVVLTMNSGNVEEARIALGAVAPVPFRAKEAEAYLQGKKLTKKVAEETAGVAVRNGLALRGNSSKVQICKALVKRALLTAH
jgi:NADPH-dependent glutamate synthase beta subunit-like oxidoreductase